MNIDTPLRELGTVFDRRVKSLGIKQIQTPVKAPKANAIAERWVRIIRNECLDHRLILGHQHLQRTAVFQCCQLLPQRQIFKCQLTVIANARLKRSEDYFEPLAHRFTLD